MNEQYDLLTNLVLVLLSTFGPVLAVACIAYLRKAHLRAQKEHWYGLVREFAETAVGAAEQLGLTGQLEQLGKKKYDYAVERLEEMLLANGIKIDLDVPIGYLKDIVSAEMNRQPHLLTSQVLHTE
jgi:hypothetical protein